MSPLRLITLLHDRKQCACAGLQSYVGKITSILMQDLLLELDDKVWLLLTHYRHTQIHGLRVGALVSVEQSLILKYTLLDSKTSCE